MLSPEAVAFLETWRQAAVLIAVIVYTAFTLLYGIAYGWRRKRAGRGVFFAFLTLVIVSALSFLATWFGEYWLRPLWSALGWTLAVAAAFYLLYALLRNWNRREKIEIEPRTGEIPRP